MPKQTELLQTIENGGLDDVFKALYGPDENTIMAQRARYTKTVARFGQLYGADNPLSIYSTPGRTEIGGNHTDHQNGIVLAGAVNLDIIAVVAQNNENVIRVQSEGFPGEDVIPLDKLDPDPTEFGRSSALVRGVAAGLKNRGGVLGGFDAYTTSDVLKGSGLSSSAAFEVCIGAILNGEYNNDKFTPVELGLISQFAENTYFGKPSGLMDQTACAVGSVISIDFGDPENPAVKRIPFDLDATGYHLVITDTKGDHADLTDEYAAIRREMTAVAACFGKAVLRQVDEDVFLGNIAQLRTKLGDRAVLRAIHFYEDCKRAAAMATCLQTGDFNAFLSLVLAAGHSAFEYNQNAYAVVQPQNQGLSLALALSQLVLEGRGAWRLQGGGFAGTIQAFMPHDLVPAYCGQLDGVFGDGASRVLTIREAGCTKVC